MTVLCCGLSTLDIVQTVAQVPGPNQKVTAMGMQVSSGGPAANAAVTASALGVQAILVTAVGQGTIGQIVRDDLDGCNVIVLDDGSPKMTPPVSSVFITAGTGDRAVISMNAVGAELVSNWTGTPVEATSMAEVLDGVEVVLVDGHHLPLCLDVAAAASRLGIPVVLDGGSWKDGLERLLSVVDIAVLSADFTVAAGVSPETQRDVRGQETTDEDTLARVAALGPKVVAQSHGSGDIKILNAGRRTGMPVPQVQVVDTLGAGDVLHGALVAYLAVALGQSSPQSDQSPAQMVDLPLPDSLVVDALAFASRAASASCAANGARGWLTGPALQQLRATLQVPHV